MADGHDEGAIGQGPCDPFLLPDDDFDDVMYLLELPGDLDPPPPPAAPVQNPAAGSSGDNLMDWPAMLDTNSVNDDGAPTHNAVAADPPSGAQQDVVGAGTSATASTSSSAAHQEALHCTGCQVLREILHSNGLEATKLFIHGAAGVFYHAILEAYYINSEGLATAPTHQSYINFRGRDYVWVKHYLTDYAQQRTGGGYTIVHDSISAFHDALCTSMNCGSHADDGRHEEEIAAKGNGGDDQKALVGAADHGAQPMMEQGDVVPSQSSGPSEPGGNEQEPLAVQPIRSALAIQRERASNLELRDIARYFHLPIVEAAKELRVCATVLKTVSRRFHIPRWPHRKIKSIDNQISILRRSGNGDAAAMREIERLTDSRRKIYAELLE